MASSSSCLVGRGVEQHNSHTAHSEGCSMLEQDKEEQQGLQERSGGQPWPCPPKGRTHHPAQPCTGGRSCQG